MRLFNKKYIINPLHNKNKEDRRNFIIKSLTALFGVAILTRAEELMAIKSRTGFIYVKQNGEIINHYKPSVNPEPYLSEIGMAAFNFAPTGGWMRCNGQILSIAQNTALFSLLGTYYGGNGQTTFALPDLRGRAPMHHGQGPGLSNYAQGTALGSETVSLAVSELPAHTHTLSGNSGAGTTSDPTSNFIAAYAEGINGFSDTANATLNSAAVSNTGGSQGHTNMQPFLVINYCIATQGIFPSQG
jgi:microcystin-dependent protein